MRRHPEDHRFHFGVAIFGYLVALSFAVIGSLLLAGVLGYSASETDSWPLWFTAVAQVPQWVGLVGVCWFASKNWGTGNIVRDFGLRFRRSDLIGVPVGVVVQLVFVKAVYLLLEAPYRALFKATEWGAFDISRMDEPARNLTNRGRGPFGVVLLILVLVVGAPLFEELFFRGLVLRSFAARANDGLALVLSAIMFGAIHFSRCNFRGSCCSGWSRATQRNARGGSGWA